MKKLTDEWLYQNYEKHHNGKLETDTRWDYERAIESEVLRINGLTAESEEQREQGQVVVGYLVEGWHEGKVIARQMYDAVDDALQTASVFARHYPTVTTKPLYTNPPTPPAGVPDGFVLISRSDAEFASNVLIGSMASGAHCQATAHRIKKTISAAPQPAAQQEDIPAIFKEQAS